MEHGVPLIATLALALALALVLGFLAAKARLPAIVGYLLAGVLIGPFTPGYVADTELARQLAEIGIMLLMFGVGLHFSLSDLSSVRNIALPGAVLQIAAATGLGGALAVYWGWSLGAALVFGLALSVASTVVLLRGLETLGILESVNGRIAVGWLVVEDIAMVLVLVLLPPIGRLLADGTVTTDPHDIAFTLAITLLKIAAFVISMLVIGHRLFPWLLWQVARTGSRELFTLCVVVAAVSLAYGASELFGVSFALGAFFAGMVIRESEFSHRAAEESLPLRDAFAVLFFVSVGMLFDPSILAERPWEVLATVSIVVVGKSLAAAALVLAFRYPLTTAITVSASLAQIGEFSFILAGLGTDLGLLPSDGQNLVLAASLISISINPLIFGAIEPLQEMLRSRSPLARKLERPDNPLAELPLSTEEKYLVKQVVMVGFGQVGGHIGETLAQHEIPFVVAEQNRDLVEQLRAKGIPAVEGNAADPTVLIQAHVKDASMLVVTTDDPLDIQQMIETVRKLNPKIEVVIRGRCREEAERLEYEEAGKVFLSETELANGMTRHILDRYGLSKAEPSSPAISPEQNARRVI
jgi:CPA2 family monovalent cation:H+ antiporter-2